jgi:hypothetical protein
MNSADGLNRVQFAAACGIRIETPAVALRSAEVSQVAEKKPAKKATQKRG